MKTRKSLRSRLPVLVGGIFLLLFAIVVVLMIRNFVKNDDKPGKPKVQQISIIKPPPPKPEEKPPEPVKQEITQDLNIPEPQQEAQPDQAPPGQNLALDAEGSAGSDGFGLGANKGGKNLIGGGGGSRFGWYTGTIQQAIQDVLTRNQPKGEFRAIVKLWVNPDGSVKRFELAGSSGKAEIDRAIESALARVKGLREPPEDMPQPIKLRISSR